MDTVLYKLLNEYNFMENSICNFSKLNNINVKTVKKYLNKWGIQHKIRLWNPVEKIQRDSHGCFISSVDKFEAQKKVVIKKKSSGNKNFSDLFLDLDKTFKTKVKNENS